MGESSSIWLYSFKKRKCGSCCRLKEEDMKKQSKDGRLQVKEQDIEQSLPSEGNNSADTLILGSFLQKREKVKFCSLSGIL